MKNGLQNRDCLLQKTFGLFVQIGRLTKKSRAGMALQKEDHLDPFTRIFFFQ